MEEDGVKARAVRPSCSSSDCFLSTSRVDWTKQATAAKTLNMSVTVPIQQATGSERERERLLKEGERQRTTLARERERERERETQRARPTGRTRARGWGLAHLPFGCVEEETEHHASDVVNKGRPP